MFPEAHKKAFPEWLPLVVHMQPVIKIDDDQFYEFCLVNRDLRIERNETGELIVMPPTGGETSERNAEITMQLRLWSKKHGGAAYDSSGGFVLPNTSIRSPDAAWIAEPRLAELTPEQRCRFIPLCPDFVVELCSPSDALGALMEKMEEYIANGARLGWLIYPEQRTVLVYRPGRPVEELENPDTLSGEPILPKFVLDLRDIW